MINTNLMSNTSCEAPFWKRRLFYSKIACLLQKVWDFGRFFKKQKAPFYSVFSFRFGCRPKFSTFVHRPSQRFQIWFFFNKMIEIQYNIWMSKRFLKILFQSLYTQVEAISTPKFAKSKLWVFPYMASSNYICDEPSRANSRLSTTIWSKN